MRYDELYHHGILGQKWGIRRFQNLDGSLTAEGRKRYGISSDEGPVRITDSIYGIGVTGLKKFEEAGRLAKISEKCSNDFNEYDKAFTKNAKNSINDPKIIDSIISEAENKAARYNIDLKKDRDFLEDLIEEAAISKIRKLSAKEYQVFDSSRNEFYKEAEKLVDNIVGQYGNEPVSTFTLRGQTKFTDTYRNAVANTVYSLADGRMVHYLTNHEEMVYADGSGSDAIDKLVNKILKEYRLK